MTREEIAEQSSQSVEEWRQKYYLTNRANSTDEELFECLMLEAYANERVKELESRLRAADAYFPEAALAKVNAEERLKELREALQTIADLAVGHGDVCEIIARRARAVLSEEGRG